MIAKRACAVILAHNHKSNNLKPSEDDLVITRKLNVAGRIIGIQVLDHLIFKQNGVFSILRDGGSITYKNKSKCKNNEQKLKKTLNYQ